MFGILLRVGGEISVSFFSHLFYDIFSFKMNSNEKNSFALLTVSKSYDARVFIAATFYRFFFSISFPTHFGIRQP